MSDQPRDISRAELGTLGIVAIVLGTVLLTPLVPAFDSSGPAQAKQAADDAARSTASQLRREIETAAGIVEPEGRLLNLRVRGEQGDQTVVRAGDAVLDIVPPTPRKRPSAEKRAVEGGGGTRPPAAEQPLAPEMVVVRFFAGLRYPINPQAVPGRPETDEPQPYVNRYDGMTLARSEGKAALADSYVARQGVNNPYLLYRANFTPYRLKKKGEPGYRGLKYPAYAVNDELFATDTEGRPILNDPDFFRVVTTNDQNPAEHRPYTPSEAAAHNIRVTHWVSLAKPVLSDLDLDVLKPRGSNHPAALSIRFVPSVVQEAATEAVPGRILFYTKGTVRVDLGLCVYDDASGRGETARRTERVEIGSDRPPA